MNEVVEGFVVVVGCLFVVGIAGQPPLFVERVLRMSCTATAEGNCSCSVHTSRARPQAAFWVHHRPADGKKDVSRAEATSSASRGKTQSREIQMENVVSKFSSGLGESQLGDVKNIMFAQVDKFSPSS